MDTISLKSTPKDVFFQLLITLTLIVSVVSFLILLFQYVNFLFPDDLDYSSYYYYSSGAYDTVRWATSILVVVFPVFLIFSWLAGREYRFQPEKRELRIRKWLMYLTLFVSAVTIIVALISLIYSFLSGELTTRFLLKVLSVLVTAAAVFGYFIWDLRRTDFTSSQPKLFVWIAGLAVLGLVISGFFIVGTPGEQRNRRFDERRSGDLQNLQYQIVEYWVRKSELPRKLDEVAGYDGYYQPPKDPETDTSYEYRVRSPLSFELCANFATKSDGTRGNGPYYPLRHSTSPPLESGMFDPSEHDTGRQCFTRTIDPDLYKDRIPQLVPPKP